MKRILFSLFLMAMSVMAGKASVVLNSTNFPDAVFRAYISSITGVAEGGTLSDEKLKSVTSIDLPGDYYTNGGITSLKGVEYFTALKTLYCESNRLTSLDVSHNTALTTLDCEGNQLSSLDVSGATALTYLDCWSNQLPSLDVSHNIALTTLYCRDNQLMSLDVSHNIALTSLWCYNNQLTSLDVSHNTALTDLRCQSNLLTSLDVSGATALTYLDCRWNLLTSLDVSHNTALTRLDCYDNQLTSLDVSGATALTELSCYSNQLTSLDVSHNTALTDLWCYYNQLTSLDVSGATALTSLHCSNNQLTGLDVSHNTALNSFDCSNNQLTGLDVSHNTALNSFDCYSNQLTSLDVSHNTALERLYCDNNQLTSLDVSHNTALTRLYCNENQLMSLDLSKCTKLESKYTSVGSQSKSVDASSLGSNQYSIDVPADFDISKVYLFKVNSTSVTPTLSNGQLVFTSSSTPTRITYQYDTSNSVAKKMGVSISITDIVDGTTSYDLTISASGNGSATYSGTSIRNKSQTFSVVKGTNATITFTPDTGYRIKSVKKNGTDVTSSVSNNKLTVSNITANTTVAVVFEEIPPTYYDLTISASGNGSASYSGTSIRNKSQTFSVVKGTNATITFTPDTGYRIKSVKKNGTDVTSSVSNNKYTVSNISANTTIAVVFEEIPPTYYDLTISASGNGSVSYNGTSIRNKSQTFSVVEGTNATITFTPDTGYRIKSVKKNATDVTSSVSNNQLTVSNISANTTVAVVFEEIPPTYYDLTISASGNGSATYSGTSIRNKSQTFSVVEGTNATITFTPDAGYRIKSVKKNGTDVTSSVSNNKYTVSNISANTTIAVVFEEIPQTYYDLTISASGNGSAAYSGTSIRNKSQTFSVVEGTNAAITFSPDTGYRIKSVKVGSTDVTSNVKNNKYTVSNLSANTTIAVVFEEIPQTYYDLTISATGNGSAAYSGTSIRNKSQTFSVAKGTNATITFTPDAGYRIKSVKVGSTDVTSNVKNNQYTVSNIEANKTVTVVFEENVYDGFTADGITYHVSSAALRTVEVKGVSTEHAVIPEHVAQYDDTWKVTAIADGAFRDGQQLVSVSVPASIETVPDGLFTSCPRLCAVVWHASVPLTAGVLGAVTNPNLLVYVDSQEQTTLSVPNIIVNGMAEEITLTEASDGNDFYCPETFSARQVSYVRHFGMTTGIGECRGWESIVLPFSVQTFYHATRGELIPFAAWDGVHGKPFWLLYYGADGFTETGSLEANVPYIISMPNNPKYASDYNLSGDITFSARNAVVKASTEMAGVTGNGKTFVPSFAHEGNTADAFILNVNGSFVNYGGAYPEGSVFIRNLRDIRPFEAYFTNVQQAKEVLPVFDDEATPVHCLPVDAKLLPRVTVYSVTGQLMKSGKNITIEEALQGLSRGVYIVNGQKYAVYEKGMEE